MANTKKPRTFQGGHFVGEVIGTRTLVEYTGQDKNGHHCWMWKSSCCNVVHGPSIYHHLIRGIMCLDCQFLGGANNPNWKGYKELTGVWLGERLYDAAKRNLTWALTPEYLWDLWLSQNGLCAYTGRQLQHGINASLDRRDNTLGYVVGNVQWVHRDINRMKSDFIEEDFVQLCKDVTSYFNKI